jgi:hypothetical protein
VSVFDTAITTYARIAASGSLPSCEISELSSKESRFLGQKPVNGSLPTREISEICEERSGGIPPAPIGTLLSSQQSMPFVYVTEAGALPLDAVEESTLVGLDIETTGFDPRADRVRLQSLSLETIDGGRVSYLIDLFRIAPTDLSPLWDALADKLLVGSSPLGRYGVATTGFNGAFQGGSISLGNASPGYGIVAAGTFDGTNGVSFGGSQFPFVQDSLTFTFSGAAGLSDANIANVKFLFGTDGTGIVNASPGSPNPAPGGLVLLASAAPFAIFLRRLRRNTAA